MQITFTIPDNKIDEFKSAFLQIYPVPAPIDEEEPIDTNVWIKRCVKRMIFSVYEQGRQKIFREQNKPTFDEGIVQ